ncbi:carcinoembryonic antigen-related cell adhesion molecule 6-like isoform X2 [Rhinatrema bivittatum]|uniref:carcinoembryonic antigen-related cell adhesion molecule 6-like isoform X2 n=1 Tax=Rhinatrema bivittatum TaxID=194408 RepID=UPI00112EA0DA|nr:carcinoembryonic antigen-related cell adhesion molecule 6-like isoform X2 [Rhinatrema bivittatum]
MEFMFGCRGPAVWRFILIVFLGFWSQQISAQISVVPIPKTLAEGSSVLLSVSFTGRIFTFTWYRGETTQNRILLYVPSDDPPEKVSPPYVGRVRGFPNGSMEISGLTTSDSGSYTVQLQTESSQPPTATVNITVSEILGKPSITASLSQPVEHRDSVTLTCGTSSTIQTILWHKERQSLPSNDRMSLSPDNRTLTISNVSIADSGSYRCEVINPVSRSTSDPYTLTVYYGPKNVEINPKGPITKPLKSQLTLDCVTESDPDPNYTWTFNGTIKGHERKLVLTDISFRDQGNYTCEAYNPVTNLSGSASVYVTASDTSVPSVLTPGAIAGIVIGILVLVALIAASIYLFLMKGGGKSNSNEIDMKENTSNPRTDHRNPSPGRNPASTGEEVNYSEVNFKPNAQKPRQAKPQDNKTEYAEIRRT